MAALKDWVVIEQEAETLLKRSEKKIVDISYARNLSLLLSKLSHENDIYSLFESNRYSQDDPAVWPANVENGSILKINTDFQVWPEHQSLVRDIAPLDSKITFSEHQYLEIEILVERGAPLWSGWQMYTEEIIKKYKEARRALDCYFKGFTREQWIAAFQEQKIKKTQNAEILVGLHKFLTLCHDCGVDNQLFGRYNFEDDYEIKFCSRRTVAYRPAKQLPV